MPSHPDRVRRNYDWKEYPSEPIRVGDPVDLEALLRAKRDQSNAAADKWFAEIRREFNVT